MRLMLMLVLGGCVTVQPWEREEHARRCMVAGFGDDGVSGAYRAKMLETKAGGGAAWTVPGGGCGCSQ